MDVHFRQIYIEVGANFRFSSHFQRRMSKEITMLASISPKYVDKFGSDFKLIFNISAKRNLLDNLIKGPGIYRKRKDVEYTVFLPFDVISRQTEVSRSALEYLFKGVYEVLQSLDIDALKVKERQALLIDEICSDPGMFKW